MNERVKYESVPSSRASAKRRLGRRGIVAAATSILTTLALLPGIAIAAPSDLGPDPAQDTASTSSPEPTQTSPETPGETPSDSTTPGQDHRPGAESTPQPPTDPAASATPQPQTDGQESPAPTPQPAENQDPQGNRELMFADNSAFQCEAGATYSIDYSAVVSKISDSGAITQVGRWNIPYTTNRPNALGIGEGGQTAYALRPEGSGRVRILEYLAESNSWNVIGPLAVPSSNSGTIVAGAVDLRTGTYIFGSFYRPSIWGNRYFYLWAFDKASNSIKYLGRFDTGASENAGNGDMAFDSAGNLYVVQSTPAGKVRIFSINAANIQNAIDNGGGDIRASRTREFTVPDRVNGISFNADGSVMLGTNETINRYDPTTWQRLGTVTTGMKTSTDLASCTSPANLVLKKNVVDRAESGDQFNLTVTSEGDAEPLAEDTTTGSSNGIQQEEVGPLPVMSGSTYAIGESLVGGDLAQKYTSTYQCTLNGNELASGTGGSGTITIPPHSAGEISGATVECTFTNTPIRTKLTLTKSFENKYGAPEDPSTWTLTAKRGQDAELAFASGETRDVPSGTYTLGEKEQPGYKISAIRCSVEGGPATNVPLTGAGANQFEVPQSKSTSCEIVNTDLPGALTWEKYDGDTRQMLAGSAWRLVGPNGYVEEIQDFTGTQSNLLDTDNRAGGFKVENLPWGDYTLEEVTAPTGYKPKQGVVAKFTVSGDSLAPQQPIAINNDQIKIALEKYGYAERGQSSPALIDGSSFEMRANNNGAVGDVVGTITPQGPGTFEITGVNPGSYWLVETQAPAGHTLLAEPIGVTISIADNGALELTLAEGQDGTADVTLDPATIKVYDQRQIELPISGGMGAGPYLMIGAALLLAAAVVTLMQLRRRRA